MRAIVVARFAQRGARRRRHQCDNCPMLKSVLHDIFRRSPPPAREKTVGDRRRVLNVGGYSKTVAIPAHYAGWEHVLLDIDPASGADVVCDARQLDTLP